MNLLLAVSGGIAAYRACDLVSQAVKAGHAVRVVMTRNATRFVGPVSLQALSGHPVLLDTFQEVGGGDGIDHVQWAKWAQVAVVAPATANTLARLALGLADDATSTVFLALPAAVPVVLAPAMNTQMWAHPATQRNLRWLAEMGRYHVVGPVEKRLACGDVGLGGMADPRDILAAVEEVGRRVQA